MIVHMIGETLSKQAHRDFDYYGSIVSGVFMILLGAHFIGKVSRRPKADHFVLQEDSELAPSIIGRQYSPEYSSDEKEPLHICISLLAGVIGGAAGPGALLAVVPAGYYSTWQESLAYIFIFMLTSTLVMGLFALGYGELTFRFAKDSDLLVKRLYLFSSSISIVVGIFWILLTLIGVMGVEH